MNLVEECFIHCATTQIFLYQRYFSNLIVIETNINTIQGPTTLQGLLEK